MRVGLFIFPVRFSSLMPIDIAYLAAYLKKHNHEVYARDFNCELSVRKDSDTWYWDNEEMQRGLFIQQNELVTQWVNDIVAFDPDVVGISTWTAQTFFSLSIARLIKERCPKTLVVIGGPQVALSSASCMQSTFVDYSVLGEGEITLREIVESQARDDPIPGTKHRIGNVVIDGGMREQIQDLDSLPFPDYSSFDFIKYLYPHYPILFNRGCTWLCSFCSLRLNWRNFYSRSAENIFAEIKDCATRYPSIQSFYSCDHSMNANIALLYRLCNLLIDDGTKRDFFGFGQVLNGMLDDDFLDKLAKAGFRDWGIGLQSGSDRILRSMKRPYTTALAERVFQAMNKRGMKIYTDFINGYPEETEEDFQQTLKFISRIRKYVDNITIHPVCFLGNNDLASNPKKYGIRVFENSTEWESEFNNPEIRKRRYKELIDHVSSLGICVRLPNSDREHFSKSQE
ncbi:MAG: radical SAM protein [Candidatus Omnitrophica bacterium]|nr:radical SAM protein [Candidatus Omnitrophota bacterium]